MLRELDAEGLATRRPIEALSGGETQRVAWPGRWRRDRARSCSTSRSLRSTSPCAATCRRFLAERLRAWSLPTVVVTHDCADAEALDGQVVVLEAGAVVQRGRLAGLAAGPATPFVKRLVSGADE